MYYTRNQRQESLWMEGYWVFSRSVYAWHPSAPFPDYYIMGTSILLYWRSSRHRIAHHSSLCSDRGRIMSSAATSLTSTASGLLAITTPFVQPSGCESQYTLTHVSTTTQVLVSQLVPSCHPSGWDQRAPEVRMNFQPAVCPSGWTYYDMADPDKSGFITTAKCCNRLKIPEALKIV